MRILLATLASWLAVGFFIALARARGWGQSVRQDGPSTHIIKDGTPTMGGVPFTLVILALWVLLVGLGGLADRKGWVTIALAAGMAIVGFIDDVLLVRSKMRGDKIRGGLKAREKFPAQAVLAIGFAVVVSFDISTTGQQWLDIIIYSLVVIGSANAVNFTDGLDGLCAGVVAIALLPLLVSSPLAGITVGALLGYLWFNSHPAQIFMGDAGSHALGAILAGVYITQGWVWVLPLAAIIPVVEVLSVVLQVGYFQYHLRRFGTGKRIFLMTPLHHHFEKVGWRETKVVGRFWGITAVGALLAWVIQSGIKW
jgi:phospho-N-acetylmuramoyl-pentapeptide-transferase